MKKLLPFIFGTVLLPLLMISCAAKQQVDFIGFNGVVYTVDSIFSKSEAFAVKDGKFVEVGKTSDILSKYEVASPDSTNYIDFNGAAVYPGLNDSHCHIYSMGRGLLNVNLRGATSFEIILDRLQAAYKENPNRSFLVGDGWDQNLWEVKEFPVNDKLNELFPDIPVMLSRIDFHAVIVNQVAIDRLGIKTSDLGTKYNKSEAIVKNGKFTGVFMENMADMFKANILVYSDSDIRDIILTAQKECFKYGLTSVSTEESHSRLRIIDSLVNTGEFKLKLDVWLAASEENFNRYNAPLSNGNIKITTLKLYSDGALGSRGATLIEPYSDDKNNVGIDVYPIEKFRELCGWAYDRGFKVATHCIGDKANRQTLDIYGEFAQKAQNEKGEKLWWRIEHAQIVNKSDIDKFGKYSVIPSIQPTHCTSDMFWATERLGDRIKDAYIYKTLLNQHGWLPSGTDFPIEQVNPIYTFFAAVFRKNLDYLPENGFQTNEALTKEEALRSMTIWGAKTTNEDNEKGSIETGKYADFIVTDIDFMTAPEKDVPTTKVKATYLNGKKVF